MPRYDVRNDGAGPYAVFYCDKCSREFRSQPDLKATVTKSVGRAAVGGLLRNIPILGSSVADRVEGEDPRSIYSLTPEQLDTAWKQCAQYFHECPTCRMLCCPSDWDNQAATCTEDSPRQEEIAEAQAQQAAGVLKGIAGVFGLGEVVRGATEAAKQAGASLARCSKCGALGQPGTKFCTECGGAMVQPSVAKCGKCGADVGTAKFCPECGAKVEAAPAKCKSCGAELKGAKFCPECGTKAG
jgi:hypothetical protein